MECSQIKVTRLLVRNSTIEFRYTTGTLGLTGSVAAAPMWKAFMERAVAARPGHDVSKPRGVVVRRVNPRSGLLYGRNSKRGREELFRSQALPRRNRFWRRDREMPVIR